MEPIELTPAWFGQCPRYLSAKRFGAMTGLTEHDEKIEDLIKQGVIPSRRIGRHLMVDMHELMLMLPSHAPDEPFFGRERPPLTQQDTPSHALATLITGQSSV